jgi:hypothetical protein
MRPAVAMLRKHHKACRIQRLLLCLWKMIFTLSSHDDDNDDDDGSYLSLQLHKDMPQIHCIVQERVLLSRLEHSGKHKKERIAN